MLSDVNLNTTVVPFVFEAEGSVLKSVKFHLAAASEAAKGMSIGQKVALTGLSEQGYASGSLYQKPDASTLLFLQIKMVGELHPLEDEAKIELLKQTLCRYETQWGRPEYNFESLPESARKHYPKEVSAWEIIYPKVQLLPRLSQQRPITDREEVKKSVAQAKLLQLLQFWDEV